MVLPKPVYEALPFGYLALGAVALFALESAVRYFSGSTLLIAGLLILHLRAQYRRQQRAPVPRRRHRERSARLHLD